MKIENEQEFLNLKLKLLSEIKYREEILSQLKSDSHKEKGFVSSFIKIFLKVKKQAPNLFWKNNETYGRYLIDADKELHNNIASAFEMSIYKLKLDYENASKTV